MSLSLSLSLLYPYIVLSPLLLKHSSSHLCLCLCVRVCICVCMCVCVSLSLSLPFFSFSILILYTCLSQVVYTHHTQRLNPPKGKGLVEEKAKGREERLIPRTWEEENDTTILAKESLHQKPEKRKHNMAGFNKAAVRAQKKRGKKQDHSTKAGKHIKLKKKKRERLISEDRKWTEKGATIESSETQTTWH